MATSVWWSVAPDWNISTTIGWVTLSSPDGSRTLYPNDYGDLLTFLRATTMKLKWMALSKITLLDGLTFMMNCINVWNCSSSPTTIHQPNVFVVFFLHIHDGMLKDLCSCGSQFFEKPILLTLLGFIPPLTAESSRSLLFLLGTTSWWCWWILLSAFSIRK